MQMPKENIDETIMSEEMEQTTMTCEPSKKINVISKEVAHKICSGQVVLDLAIAIKELVENSLDSGATYVDIKLMDYGQTCITVSDNGSGVLESDFEGLGLKHHTSKLRDFSDIFEISTFGFRGEALSSLCSLSDLTITTKHSNNEHAYKLQFDRNGKLTKKDICAREIGTTVTVKNIFKCLPVRAKEFQRNIKKEFTKALQVLYGYCLVSTGVKITCSNSKEGKPASIVLSTTGTDGVLNNISSIFGKKSLVGLETIKLIDPDEILLQEFNLSGDTSIDFTWEFYASSGEEKMGCTSPSRQFFYINGRPCVLTKINKIINNLYHKFNHKQYPFVYLNLQLKQNTADVNVTPDKRTIFLAQEKLIMATVKMSLQTQWEKNVGNFTSMTLNQIQNSFKRSLPPSFIEKQLPTKKKMISPPEKTSDDNSIKTGDIHQKIIVKENQCKSDWEITQIEKLPDTSREISIESIQLSIDAKNKRQQMKKKCDYKLKLKYRTEIDATKSADAEKELRKQLTMDSFTKMEIIGQFNLGFIITQHEGDLFIIDQHATDEKYRFEKLSDETKLKTQKLIAPKSLNLSSLNETIVMDHPHFFEANGFSLLFAPEAQPGQRVHLTGMPVSGNWQFGQEDLEELIFLIREGGSESIVVRPSRVRSMLASRACRGAVMIGTALNNSEMCRLIKQMGQMKSPWNCPHGRPTLRHLLSLKLLKNS